MQWQWQVCSERMGGILSSLLLCVFFGCMNERPQIEVGSANPSPNQAEPNEADSGLRGSSGGDSQALVDASPVSAPENERSAQIGLLDTENPSGRPPDETGTWISEQPGSSDTEPSDAPPVEELFYTVAHYDPKADPAADLQHTLARARAERKTVLLQVGGDWCGWCKRMTEFIAKNEPVNQRIQQGFLIQKITYDQENRNEPFLSGYPKINGYPHLFVLAPDGQLLHSQDTAELEQGGGYSEDKFIAFLEKWKTKSD